MLPKTQRLSKNELSSKISSRVLTTPFFSLKLRKNDLVFNRFAFIVSKKVDMRSVVRNRLKRRMSVAVGVLPKNLGYDCVFYMKKGALGVKVAELEKIIKDLAIK